MSETETETPDSLVALLATHELAEPDMSTICECGFFDSNVDHTQHIADVIRAAGWVQRDERSYLGRHVLERTGMRTRMVDLPLHRTEAGYPTCSTCDGGGCHDCTDPA
ncbi:hypothetical protein [Nocardioides bruguierae]|uniref:Uncharacterized protein n=1 Tax=Nocardioides bruguierae TaxID=2945102 RepID=A0A9X2DBR7_9ACTN|nr:hypothetical protein [Nocardioides bruguierae]MCM0622699.1 hypothetical protein [Nocardioides bruguierae]